MEFLSHAQYLQRTGELGGSHWKNAPARWAYHEAAISMLREIGLTDPAEVLEMGTMGVSIVPGSDTIDYAEKWNYKGFRPTFLHDARKTPWPVADGAYRAFVALRVYQHLHPVQQACFREARRVARNIVIVAPETYDVPELRDSSRGVPAEDFTAWNDGVPPTLVVRFADWIGNLYFWNEHSLHGRTAEDPAP